MGFKKIITLLILFGAVTVMMKLGYWQLQRLEWKNTMIADMQAQEDTDPTQNALNLDNPANFAMGYINVKFNDKIIKIGPRTHDGNVGEHIYSIVQTTEGKNIAINLGWVGMDEEPIWPDLYPQRFAGYLRNPDAPNAFTPENDIKNNYWYSYNASDFKEFYDLNIIEDKVFYALTPIPSSNIQPFKGLPYPRNKHAQYAAFWFGMSGLLIALSGFYIWRQQKIKRA